jgi:hypothetical protein
VVVYKPLEKLVPVPFFTLLKSEYSFLVALPFSKAIYTGNTCNYNNILPFQEGFGCGEAKLFYSFIYGCVFFNIDITGRNISLWLIVIVVTHKIID